ncbi:MAG: hypothetical protein ABEJ47_05300 [Halorhabdus sp.]
MTAAAAGLFVWGLWTFFDVWGSMGALIDPVDTARGDFVGPNPVVGLMGLVVLAVFLGGLVALVGEAGSDEQPVTGR